MHRTVAAKGFKNWAGGKQLKLSYSTLADYIAGIQNYGKELNGD